jgi:hypothetical protein
MLFTEGSPELRGAAICRNFSRSQRPGRPGRCLGRPPTSTDSPPNSPGARTCTPTPFGRALRCWYVRIQSGRTDQPIRCRLDRNDGERISVARPDTESSPQRPVSAICCRCGARPTPTISYTSPAFSYGIGDTGSGSGITWRRTYGAGRCVGADLDLSTDVSADAGESTGVLRDRTGLAGDGPPRLRLLLRTRREVDRPSTALP